MNIEIGSSNKSTQETRGCAARAISQWNRLGHEFRALLEEEHRIIVQPVAADLLYAYFTFTESGGFGGLWLEGGATESFAERFELLIMKGGIALDPPPGTCPRAHWLHSLLLHLRANESNHLRPCNHSAGLIERLSEACATYCVYLERCALERAARIPSTDAEFLVEDDSIEERSRSRCAVVIPILQSKRWTRSRWTSQAGVGKNSGYDYLSGKRNLSIANRRSLAEELGLEPEQLPD
jgi:hypothetical protein